MLNLHIPPRTYPERILKTLEQKYNEHAKTQDLSLRTEQLHTIQLAQSFVQSEYNYETFAQRVRVDINGNVEIFSNQTVSNLRIFFD
jgi:hypothetical protein